MRMDAEKFEILSCLIITWISKKSPIECASFLAVEEFSEGIVIASDLIRLVLVSNSLRNRTLAMLISGGKGVKPEILVLKNRIFANPSFERSMITMWSACNSSAFSATPSRLSLPRLTRITLGIECVMSLQKVLILSDGSRDVVNNTFFLVDIVFNVFYYFL